MDPREIDPRDTVNGESDMDLYDGTFLRGKGYTVIAPGVVTVTISRADFDSLKEDADTLRKLENAGVDNWEWYGEALRGGDDD